MTDRSRPTYEGGSSLTSSSPSKDEAGNALVNCDYTSAGSCTYFTVRLPTTTPISRLHRRTGPSHPARANAPRASSRQAGLGPVDRRLQLLHPRPHKQPRPKHPHPRRLLHPRRPPPPKSSSPPPPPLPHHLLPPQPTHPRPLLPPTHPSTHPRPRPQRASSPHRPKSTLPPSSSRAHRHRRRQGRGCGAAGWVVRRCDGLVFTPESGWVGGDAGSGIGVGWVVLSGGRGGMDSVCCVRWRWRFFVTDLDLDLHRTWSWTRTWIFACFIPYSHT
ncbi:hypothetical protein C8F01DRAFT_669627 [Mycena amicta]|nr:hypothetical protein C8F01DRAFT_669627 [Mycena amicta]